MMASGGLIVIASVRSVVEAVALTVDDAAFEPVEQRKSRAISGTAVGKSPGHKSVRRSSASDRFRIEPPQPLHRWQLPFGCHVR